MKKTRSKLDKYLSQHFKPEDYIKPNYHSARFAWINCKKEVLKIIKNTKIRQVSNGIEGLGGPYYEYMDAKSFKELLIKKLEKL